MAKKVKPAPGVPQFLAALDHPRKREIGAARAVILGVDPAIGEGIKWNAPSFRTTEYFATVNLRAADGLQLIFHLGAKKRAVTGEKPAVPDPGGLVTWLAADRFLLALGAGPEFDANRAALAAIVRAWLPYV